MQTFRQPSKWLIWGIGIFVALFVASIIVIAMGPPLQDDPNSDPGLGPEDDTWWAVLYDPAEPDRLFAAGQRNLYQRHRTDAAWNTVHPQFDGLPFLDLASDGDAGTLYAGVDLGVGVVVRDAQGWRQLDRGLPAEVAQAVTAVAAVPGGSVGPFAWVRDEGLFRLELDEAQRETWAAAGEVTGELPDVMSLLALPGEPVRLVAGDGRGIRLSRDGGLSWEEGPSLGERAVFGLANHPDRPEEVWAANFAGLFRSQDGGETWAPVTMETFPALQLITVAVHPEDPAQLVVVDNANRLYETRDGGESWERLW